MTPDMNAGVTPPERQATLRLRDGRALSWYEWGPIEGLPVLFCTGAAMSGSLGFGANVLPDLGLKLIAIDRPGLGSSDPHPDKTLSSWVEDTRELIAAKGLRDVTAVGFSQGAPFALALAGHGLVKAVALVSGQDELAHPRLLPLLHPEAFQRSLREGFSQGARGYARDLVNALGPWPVAPERITVPVDLWYGRADTSTVHSPDFGATLASRLPNATHTVDAEEGGSILWTKARDILTKLASRRS